MQEISIINAKQYLTKLKGTAVSFEYMSKLLGCSKQYLSQNSSKFLTSEQIKIIEQKENIRFTDVNNDLSFTAKLFTDVIGSCGNGVFEQSQNYELITLPQKLVDNYSNQKSYSVITAYGDSMMPFINDKDKLIIEHIDNNVITDNRVYVFCFDNQIYVKRLVKNIDEIVVVSDNPDKTIYKTKTINNANIDNFFLIGQVVGLFRNLSEV